MQKSTFFIMGIFLLTSACGVDDSPTPKSNASTMVKQLALEDCSEFGCPNGCVQIDYGVDDNANGGLDASEIDGTEYICHGSDGQPGEPGTQGETGAQGEQGETGAQGEQGESGDQGAQGESGAQGEQGEPGEDGADGSDAYPVLIESEKHFVDMYGCDQGYQITHIGIDDGLDGAVADDGILQETEIRTSSIACLAPDLDDDSLKNLEDDCPEIFNLTDACTPSYTQDGSACLPNYAESGAACSDGNNSTNGDACNGSGSCSGTPYSCPGASACTVGYTQDGVGCVPEYLESGFACSDGNNGTANDVCNGSGTCAGTPFSCPSPTTCTPNYTPDGSGCVANFASAGTVCNDGNNGTANDVCNGSGSCAGTPFSCPSPTTCTPNYTPNGSSCVPTFASPGLGCDDGNNSTKNDACNGSGSCAGMPYACPSPTACTFNYIQDGSGCIAQHAIAGTPCNDGNPSTSGDSCNGMGMCSGTF